MKLFLFQQGDEHIASRELLRLAVRQYEAKRIQTADNGEFLLDSPSSFRETEKTGTDLDSHSANTPSLRILEAPGGKPFLADERGQMRRPFFSVTHTGSWWLCAVAEHPLGIGRQADLHAAGDALAEAGSAAHGAGCCAKAAACRRGSRLAGCAVCGCVGAAEAFVALGSQGSLCKVSGNRDRPRPASGRCVGRQRISYNANRRFV